MYIQLGWHISHFFIPMAYGVRHWDHSSFFCKCRIQFGPLQDFIRTYWYYDNVEPIYFKFCIILTMYTLDNTTVVSEVDSDATQDWT